MSDQALYTAIIALHAEVKTLAKDAKNQQAGFTYAKADSVVREARALLAKHGLAWMRTGAAVKAPELLAGDIGKPSYVGDVHITGRIIHSSGESMVIEASVPIVAMRATPHDKAWAASVTFGTGYLLLGFLNQDRAEASEVNNRDDSDPPTCTGEHAHLAKKNTILSEELAEMDGAGRGDVWNWACKEVGVAPLEFGYPSPDELFAHEAPAVAKVMADLIATKRGVS